MENIEIPSWMDITQQQYQLLMVVKRLQLQGESSTPKNIIKEYHRLCGKTISRPNLFNQINPLLKRNLISKVERGLYQLNILQIKNFLEQKKKKEKEKLSGFNKFTINLESELSKIASTPGKPVIEYVPSRDFFTRISESIMKAKKWYADSPYPNITYPYALTRKISRTDFFDAQWTRSMKEKTLDSYYLTNLRIDFVYYRALKAFGRKSRALRECEIALARMDEINEIEDKIHMRYIDPLPGPHMYIFEFEKDKPQELFLCLRGSNVGREKYIEYKDPYGGVRIISPEIATQAKETYTHSFKHAKSLKGKFRDKILKEKHNLLMHIAT